MITFSKIRFKNFLSYGNYFTEVNLDSNKITVIHGANGFGKSTIQEAICFSLFGEPFRKINKNQIPNSINKRHCVTEIEFSIGATKYKIIRGIAPNILELYVNDVLKHSDSSVKIVQDYINNNILMLDKKSFVQTTIVGPATFSPFMQLSAKERRDVIEDILEFKDIAKLLQYFKKEVSLNNTALAETQTNISSMKTTIDALNNTIKGIKKTKLDNNQEQIVSDLSNQLSKFDKTQMAINAQNNKELLAKQSIQQPKVIDLNGKCDRITNKLQQACETTTCPTCRQELSSETKHKICITLEEEFDNYDAVRKTAIFELDEINTELASLVKFIEQIEVAKNISTQLRTAKKQLDFIENNTSENTNKIILKINKLQNDIDSEYKVINELQVKHNHLVILKDMFEDTGIKKQIIDELIPTINVLMDKYLGMFGFNITFELDSEFKETIKSRGYDKFSYYSFSEGEKKRIDLALLFTWREIARMRNSSTSNLLFLDEILDSALDDVGTSAIKQIIDDEHTNTGNSIFIITHNPDIINSRGVKLTVYKTGQFSHIK